MQVGAAAATDQVEIERAMECALQRGDRFKQLGGVDAREGNCRTVTGGAGVVGSMILILTILPA